MILPTARMKLAFFDRAAVINRVAPHVRKALSKAGAYVATVAKNSIKERPAGVYSKSGNPPYSHVGAARRRLNARNVASGLQRLPTRGGFRGLKHIYYAYDAVSGGVIVGPVSNRTGRVPHTLEFGGTVSVRGADRRRKYVRIAARPFMSPALVVAIRQGKVLEPFKELI